MALIHHDQGIVLVGQVANAADLSHVAIHGEDPVGDDDLEPVPRITSGFELGLQVRHVVVGIAVPGRLAEPHPIDDGRVVERI